MEYRTDEELRLKNSIKIAAKAYRSRWNRLLRFFFQIETK